VPHWYPLLRAARSLGVAPWEMEKISIEWRERALTAEQAEVAHQEYMQKRANRKHSMSGIREH
jgi:hypothetical protein